MVAALDQHVLYLVAKRISLSSSLDESLTSKALTTYHNPILRDFGKVFAMHAWNNGVECIVLELEKLFVEKRKPGVLFIVLRFF